MEVRSSAPLVLCSLLSTSGNGDRFCSFVQKLLWKPSCPFPQALKGCLVRLHCNQITQEGGFSFSFLKLGFYLCASTTEIETLAKRGPLNGAPSCHGSQTHLLNPQQTGRHVTPGRSGYLCWFGKLNWFPEGLWGTKDIHSAFQTRAGALHRGTRFPIGAFNECS